MSIRRRQISKQGQKYQNTTAFKVGRYGMSRQVKVAASVSSGAGLCSSCRDKLEWKKKYGKYKPLTVPKKCVSCGEKRVKLAYRTFCQECAQSKGVCAKCGEKAELIESFPMSPQEQAKEEAGFRKDLKALKERERRTLLREEKKAGKKRTPTKDDCGENEDGVHRSEESEDCSEVEDDRSEDGVCREVEDNSSAYDEPPSDCGGGGEKASGCHRNGASSNGRTQ